MNDPEHIVCHCQQCKDTFARNYNMLHEANLIIGAFIEAFRAYEMDVDTTPPQKHKAMTDRATAFLE